MMKKSIMILMVLAIAGIIQAQDAPKLNLSGTLNTGFKLDLSEDAQEVYAFSDENGTPIWLNIRGDYSFNENTGATFNLRATDTGQSLGSQGRAIPFVNRGLAWMKFLDGKAKVRTGYLWDTDYESSNNAWDTVSVLEWCTSVDFFPADGIQFGFVLPTPLAKTDAEDILKDVVYGLNLNIPSFGRVSAMGQYGSEEARRSVNFGVDFTAIKDLLVRVEGDLQQVGYADLGYYQLFQEVGFTLGKFNPKLEVTEMFYKEGSVNTFTPKASMAYNDGLTTLTAAAKILVDADGKYGARQLQAKIAYKLNAKSTIKGGVYFNAANDDAPLIVSPFFNLMMSF